MSTPESRQPQGGPEIQVPPEHYFEGYDDLPRFVSYFYQADWSGASVRMPCWR
jgi:hypothetical protein